jgi:hypothetical protein
MEKEKTSRDELLANLERASWESYIRSKTFGEAESRALRVKIITAKFDKTIDELASEYEGLLPGNPRREEIVNEISRLRLLSTLAPEISGKQLELLKEVLPQLSRVAVLGYSTRPGNAQALGETRLVAKAFGVQLQYLDVLDPKDLESAFRAASKGRADAVWFCQATSLLLIELSLPIWP